MGDFFKVPKARNSKRKGGCDFLQPTKKPGFSMCRPGLFKKSFYWKTIEDHKAQNRVQLLSEASSNDLSGNPSEEPPRRENEDVLKEVLVMPLESPEEQKRRKVYEYSDLVDDCRQRVPMMLEKLNRLLAEGTITSKSSSTSAQDANTTTSTSNTDTRWLNNLQVEDQSVTSFDLETQLLNEITGGRPDLLDCIPAVGTPLQTHMAPGGRTNYTTNEPLTPLLDMIDTSLTNFCSLRSNKIDLEEDVRKAESHFSWDNREIEERSCRLFFDFRDLEPLAFSGFPSNTSLDLF
ncbi:uncharacterized protein LOC129788172 [Lutzomyia longipalpis]|uniref:uncharacterized protein LOC129788172 n=1 Tax=Lutzomyia longipalpis TaxID=7200 RepID=UPI002483F764|nr:uncharacterized protein LOC129788172 [Lutzomyia longipalpis]